MTEPGFLPRIALLAVGGTIAMAGSHRTGVTPALDAGTLLAAVPGLDAVARPEPVDLFGIPGPHMALDSLIHIHDAIRHSVADGCTGVVVSQGTDTIEEAAFALHLLGTYRHPVVVTGALRHPGQAGADGPANLLAAMRVASASTAAGLGVLVVLNDTIHAADRVTKGHASRPDAFLSRGGPMGEVVERRVCLDGCREVPGAGAAAGCITPAAVALMPAVLGDDGRLLAHLPECGYRGLVLDGMGGGHVPPVVAHRLDQLPAEFPVVITSRTGGGRTLHETYGYAGAELDLEKRGVIRAGRLDGPKARMAMSLLLGAGADRQAIRSFFTAFGG